MSLARLLNKLELLRPVEGKPVSHKRAVLIKIKLEAQRILGYRASPVW